MVHAFPGKGVARYFQNQYAHFCSYETGHPIKKIVSLHFLVIYRPQNLNIALFYIYVSVFYAS